ncbi:MAG: hypothetical protein GQF41_4001 [Candidatus Rifleibacterium amylolyticum]|nr:MAG: hypothetical protein GQF41_4001 [Candidatus Rifleibacterium amylolyticum]
MLQGFALRNDGNENIAGEAKINGHCERSEAIFMIAGTI